MLTGLNVRTPVQHPPPLPVLPAIYQSSGGVTPANHIHDSRPKGGIPSCPNTNLGNSEHPGTYPPNRGHFGEQAKRRSDRNAIYQMSTREGGNRPVL